MNNILITISIAILLAGCQSESIENPPPTLSPTERPALPNQTATEPEPTAAIISPIETEENMQTEQTQNTANADVTYVRAVQEANGSWTFYVTVNHPDTGWEDYADGWDVVLPDGTVVKPDPNAPFTRLLLHPHVGEQPFTRSQSGIIIPGGLSQVIVRAHDLVDGFGGQEITIDLNTSSGQNYEIEKAQ